MHETYEKQLSKSLYHDPLQRLCKHTHKKRLVIVELLYYLYSLDQHPTLSLLTARIDY